MNTITSFFFLFSLHLVAATRPVAPAMGTNLISEVCNHSGHKDLCVSALQSNPTSQTADLKQLALIALKLASANATDTNMYINGMLSNETLDPMVQQSLTDCSQQFLDAKEQLDNSISATQTKAYNDVHNWVKTAVADAESCEDGFSENPEHKSLLSHRNRIFRQLCNNALAINKLLLQTNYSLMFIN